MSSYISVAYLALFLPVVIICYCLLPKRFRPLVLLLSSYGLFWIISGKLLAYLLLSTISIHYFGLWLTLLQRERDDCFADPQGSSKKEIRARYMKKQRLVIAFGVILHIGTLVVLKYTPFFGENLNELFSRLHLPVSLTVPEFAVPIGLSFYTLQAVSYIMDVYHEKIEADRNLGRLALFMSFFPQIMEGPICRYSDTAVRLWSGDSISFRNLTFGIQRILFGMLKKVVIADRLNLFIQTVFDDYSAYSGGIIAVSAVLYTCQLYMEFSGTMDVVIGSGEIFGVTMPENFRQPFFSRSISEFWQRWHITLGTWFKDYIFYPLSMSGPLKKVTSRARKRIGSYYGPLLASAIALFCVWFGNGLWHGAGWNYIFFGMYHFILILAGSIFTPCVKWICGRLHISRDSTPYHAVQIVKTSALVCVGELFFRAPGLEAGLDMFHKMVTDFSFTCFTDGTILGLGMDWKDFLIVGVTVLLVTVTSILRERGVRLREWTAARKLPLRWAIYYGLILFVVIFGAYGLGYVPIDPIYANF